MTKDEALLMCLEYIEKNAHERKYVRHAIKSALEAKEEPVNLNYQPDWKEEYQKAVELHCITLDELREGMALNRKLEKIVADQDALLERQTARIVDLQTHIDNFDGEDR